MTIDAANLHFQILNDLVRHSTDPKISVEHCNGQRYIASGQTGKEISIYGTAGNALGAYLDGATVEVFGNAQEAVGDTMNDGEIIIHGSSGDATGYAMRGGKIFVQGNAGYRAGIHMKAYQNKCPVLVIGGRAGSFLGEYQAGGLIIVLGLAGNGEAPVDGFCGTGMHGGKILLRCQKPPVGLPEQVLVKKADKEDLVQALPHLNQFCRLFAVGSSLIEDSFYLLTPNTSNPYHQLYTQN